MNKKKQTQVQVISPYWDTPSQCWVFDDERHGLVKEAFVMGASEMISDVVRDVPDAEDGFRLLFSHEAIPGAQRRLERLREDCGGWWYRCEGVGDCWLCPALFRYFDEAPQNLFVRAEPLVSSEIKPSGNSC